MPSQNENKSPFRMTDEGWAAIKAIRALVASLKETSTVQSVMRDYRAIEGEALPYRKFGFATVEEFLQASGEFVIKQSAGEGTRIYIKPNRDSAHIQNMVSAQKSSGGRPSGSSKRSNFVALRQPTTPALSGRGFDGKATQYSRIYQQLPGSGRNNATNSVSPKKISFKTPVSTTTTATSPKSKGSGFSSANPPSGGSRPIVKTQASSNKGPASRNSSNSSSPEANNNNRTAKNLNGAAQQQQQLAPTDLRHYLNERNSMLSRSSVEMRQTNRALLPLSTAGSAGGGGGGSGGAAFVASIGRKQLPLNVADTTPSPPAVKQRQQQQKQQAQQQVAQQSSNTRKPLQQWSETSTAQQRSNNSQLTSSNNNRSNGVGSARPILPLMSIDITPPTTATTTMPAKSVNARLQIAKAVLPVAAEKTPPQTPPTPGPGGPVGIVPVSTTTSTNTFQRTQSLDEKRSFAAGVVTLPSHVPTAAPRVTQQNNIIMPSSSGFTSVVAPTASIGKKSLQDRLKVNQQVAEKDLETVAKLTQQQQPAPFERTLSSASTNSVSSVTSEQTSVIVPANKLTTFSWSDPNATPVELLVKYSNYKGYVRPEYRYYRLKNGRIQCRVTLNGTAYSTYPADFGNEFEGQFAAALAAIEAIQRDESRQTYSVCLDADSDIAGAIYDLLASCPHGMFTKNIPDAFQAARQALLPDHWFSIIDRYANQLFVLEDGPGDTIVFARDQPSSSDAESNTSEARQMAMNQLALPWDEQYWNLYITNPVSTVEVWARLVGKEYSDKMDALITDIEMSMLNAQPKPEETVAAVGEYYLVSITDCWYRVRVDEINYEANQCQCFFIDVGEKEQLALDALCPCDPKYLQLPGQAKCFTLDGLEDFSENPKGKYHLDKVIVARVFIGAVVTKREEYEAAELAGGPGSGTLKLILYDTSSPYDVLLNPILLSRICFDTPEPELNRTAVNYVSISYVDDQGDVYCQKDGKMNYIQKLITNLTQSNEFEREHRGLYEPVSYVNQRLYMVQDETDGKWYRASVDEKEPSGVHCRVLYVDVGCRRRVNVSDLYQLEMISMALNYYPPQAIRMRMFELPGCGNASVLARLRAFLRPAMPAMAKVLGMESCTGTGTGTVPLVKVYVHVAADGGETGNKILVCVNEAIKIEQELEMGSELISSPRIVEGSYTSDTDNTSTGKSSSPSSVGGYTLSSADGMDLSSRFDGLNISRTATDGTANARKKATTTSTPSSTTATTQSPGLTAVAKLAKPTLPPVGHLFDVKVTIASSPKFFIVQPYAYAKQLNQLMHELQDFCMTKAQPVRKEQVRPGEAYAALNRDGYWYRAVVVNVILFGPTPVHAYFCDFGLVEMLDVSNLRVLPAKFRVLPQQAIKAKLYGVKPLNKDWQTGDAVRFQELTIERKFASIIRKVEADEFDKHEELVELELIDVSGEDDIYLHKVLVDEDRAVYTAEAHTV